MGPSVHDMSATDPIDERILRELARDARITNAELAKRANLSASATSRRVVDLERRGVIRGYRAVIEDEGRAFVAYVAVGLSDHSKPAQERFERSIGAAAQVRECHNITGTFEYLLRVEVADITAYKSFHTDILGALAEVRTITSYIVMGSPKDERG